jgi:uncharacterized protein (TIGR02246 family)
MNLSAVLRKSAGLLGIIAAFAAFDAGAQRASPGDVEELAARWASAYNKHDRAALGAFYTDGARLMMHGATTISGRQAIESFWAGDFEDRDPLTLLTVTHSVAGSDMLLVHGDYEVVSRTDGSELGGGRFAHIWTRTGRNDEWRLDRDLWNEPFDPYTAAEVAAADEVQTLASRWTAAYNQADRAALQALYTDEARLMMHGAPTIAGRADIGAFWAQDFAESAHVAQGDACATGRRHGACARQLRGRRPHGRHQGWARAVRAHLDGHSRRRLAARSRSLVRAFRARALSSA